MTKKEQSIIERYKNSKYKYLCQCYNNYSVAKEDAENEILEEMKKRLWKRL